MANFWSGFNQGFQPYGTRAADLISRTILNNKQYEREQKDKQTIEQQKAFQQNLLNQQYDTIEEEVKGGNFANFTKLPSERRVAINQYIDHTEPKKLYQREDVPGKGKIWYEVTVPKEGEPAFKELSVTPTEMRKDVVNVGGKQVTKMTYTDGKELITETKPESGTKKTEIPRRELFNNAKTETEKQSVKKFMDAYKNDIDKLNVDKNLLKKLEEDGYDTEASYFKLQAGYEKKKIETRNGLIDLFADRDLAKDIDDMVGLTPEQWDVVYGEELNAYLTDNKIDQSEDNAIQLLHYIYTAEHGKPSQLLKPYIR